MPLTLAHTLKGHTDVVWCVSWSPSGKALASCGADKSIRVWVLEPDVDAIAAGKADATKFVCKQVLDGTHSRTVRWVSWSPNGRYLASAGFDGITAIWENQNGELECVATLEGHENEVKCVSWARGGQLLATCSRDKSVWIWAADASDKEFECLSVLNGHTQDVKVARWHPREEGVLISAGYDNTIKVWTEEDDDWYCTETLTGHTSTVWALAFSPDGSRLASCSDDKRVLLWTHDSSAAAASADANTYTSSASARGGGRGSWRLQGSLSGAHTRCIYTLDWDRSGVIASGGADDTICIYAPTEVGAAAASAVAAASSVAAAAALSPAVAADASSATAASSTAAAASAVSPVPDLSLVYRQFSAHAGDVNCVAWSPTTTAAAASAPTATLASAGDDATVKVWTWQK